MIKKKHDKFKYKIYEDNYELLDEMYNMLITGDLNYEAVEKMKINLKGINSDKQKYLIKYRISIYYVRICSLIENILKEYENNVEEAKNAVNYYVFNNGMKEMNYFGLGWYYDVKFNKKIATIYSSEYIQEVETIWDKGNTEHNRIKDNILQSIMKGCRDHINRGNEEKVKLISFSKCFGIDLFKYMYLNNDRKLRLSIVKNAEINKLYFNNNDMSIQKYKRADINEVPDFCLDFSEVRNSKTKEFNSWFKRFLGEEFISQKELEEKKKEIDADYSNLDSLVYILLKEEHLEEGKAAVSSRMTPIKDKEVIISNNELWEMVKYEDSIAYNELEDGKCYSFELDEKEYIQLIYEYYSKLSSNMYSKVKEISEFKEIMQKNVDNLKDENNKPDSELEELQGQSDDEELQKRIDEKRGFRMFIATIINFIEDYVLSENFDNKKGSNNKINAILSAVDWNYEIKNKDLIIEQGMDNVYKRNAELNRDIKIENYLINNFKVQIKKYFGA